jgi:hypothetical protein
MGQPWKATKGIKKSHEKGEWKDFRRPTGKKRCSQASSVMTTSEIAIRNI